MKTKLERNHNLACQVDGEEECHESEAQATSGSSMLQCVGGGHHDWSELAHFDKTRLLSSEIPAEILPVAAEKLYESTMMES